MGTSSGSVLVYRTPNLKIIPIVTGKPYLTTYCHSSAVRVLISTHSISTMAGNRLNWFISQEQEEFEQEQEKLSASLGTNSTLSSTTSRSSGGFSRKASSKSSVSECTIPEVPEEEDENVETFPPLPPPVFSDEQSPDKVASKETIDGGVTSLYTIMPNNVAESDQEQRDLTLLSEVTSKTAAVNGTPDAHPYLYSQSPRSKPITTYRHDHKEENEDGFATFKRIPTPTYDDTFRRIPTPTYDDTFRRIPTPTYDDTFRRIPTPTYDDDSNEPETSFEVNKPPSPYEHPASLTLTSPTAAANKKKKTTRSLHKYVTTLDQSMLPSHIPELVQGIDYVLTGGRGLINLRKKKRTSIHYISMSGNDVSTAEESCIVAYALKQ